MIGSLLYCINSLVFQIRNYALLFVYKRNLDNFCFWNWYLIIKWDHGWVGLILACSTQILFTFNQYHRTFTVSVGSLILFKKSLFSVCLTQTPFRTLNLCFFRCKKHSWVKRWSRVSTPNPSSTPNYSWQFLTWSTTFFQRFRSTNVAKSFKKSSRSICTKETRKYYYDLE